MSIINLLDWPCPFGLARPHRSTLRHVGADCRSFGSTPIRSSTSSSSVSTYFCASILVSSLRLDCERSSNALVCFVWKLTASMYHSRVYVA